MSQVPGQVWRRPGPLIAAATSDCEPGLRNSLPSSDCPMPTVPQLAPTLQNAGTLPEASSVQRGFAEPARPSEKRTMKSALQPLQGPLLPWAMALPGSAAVVGHHGFSWPPMYQAVLKSISAIGFATLV